MSGTATLVSCLAGCGLWLEIPDDPRWSADASAPTVASETAPPSGSSLNGVSTQATPGTPAQFGAAGVGTPATSQVDAAAGPSSPTPSMGDLADRAPDGEGFDAGSAPPDPEPPYIEPEPPADPEPPYVEPEPPADPEPPYVEPEPPYVEPEPPAGNVPPPNDCRGVESRGPNGRCYAAVSELLSWNDARRNCRARGNGWDLTAIRSNAVNRFVGELIVDEAWIGATDAATESTWVWVDDGEPFWTGTGAQGRALNGAYENWNSDEPNGGINTNCTRLVTTISNAPFGSPAWADLECLELRASVCEGPAR